MRESGSARPYSDPGIAPAHLQAPVMSESTDVTERVRSFYDALHFNYFDSDQLQRRVESNLVSMYTDLDALLRTTRIKTAIEIGCGNGWLANELTYHYGKRVVGVDICGKALKSASCVAEALGVADRVRFVEGNLFDYSPADLVDLVVSVGVLHHTCDCRGAALRIAGFVRPGGMIYLGLYHSYGRKIFLKHFREIVAREGEEAAFARFRSLRGHSEHELHERSWFRDQVLHPYETQHTLEEVIGWFAQAGIQLKSTSINHFGPVDDLGALIRREKEYAEISRRANLIERRYFPGFFTVMGQQMGD